MMMWILSFAFLHIATDGIGQRPIWQTKCSLQKRLWVHECIYRSWQV